MRSSDLARLAGVTVRTLRHYHQIGLLPEPERSANGYRLYTTSDLVRVLRARRLADVGVPLGRIDPAVDVEDELAALDRRYAEQIAELQERRAVIGELRRLGPLADTPAYALGYIAALGDRQGMPVRLIDAERDAAVVLELFLDPGAWPGLGVVDGPDAAQLAVVTDALLGLADDAADDAADERIDAVADSLAAVIGRVQHLLAAPQLTRESAQSLEHHVSGQLTPVQFEAVRRALDRLPPY
ncbi:MerR family transcriptional regulator [Herbiconiux sp. YIM B11900]|uniref:MerR family transcriptional regulator n=1 Tax=Herbiconiux sp. YIM B11900 TaxID=3404131 RepID=UPI003F83DC6D